MPLHRLTEGIDKFDEWFGVYPLLVFPVRIHHPHLNPNPDPDPNPNPTPNPNQARLPAAGTELLRVQMPFVAFSAAEVASCAQTLPQSHTCDHNILEPPLP